MTREEALAEIGLPPDATQEQIDDHFRIGPYPGIDAPLVLEGRLRYDGGAYLEGTIGRSFLDLLYGFGHEGKLIRITAEVLPEGKANEIQPG